MAQSGINVGSLPPRLRSSLTPLTGKTPGVGIAFTVGFAASFLSGHYGAPAMLFALLLGMALNFLFEDERSAEGINFSADIVLRIGIALLGFRIAFNDVLALGWQTLALVAGGVGLTMLFGLVAARSARLDTRIGVLTGGAVAICGTSAAMAIAAALPQSPNKERDTAFVVVGVTALSTLAMILYPVLTMLSGLNDHTAGVFLGGTIHDVAQVVGAGHSISMTTGDVATLTKLLRVSMLLPVVLMLSLVFRIAHDGESSRPPHTAGLSDRIHPVHRAEQPGTAPSLAAGFDQRLVSPLPGCGDCCHWIENRPSQPGTHWNEAGSAIASGNPLAGGARAAGPEATQLGVRYEENLWGPSQSCGAYKLDGP